MKLSIRTASVFQPLLKASRYKGAYGGRGSGKSHFFAELLVEHCVMVPGTRAVCVREVQRSLKDSVKRLVEDKIEVLGVAPKFRAMNDQINAPGNGIILFQGMQDHTAESIKSLEGFDIAYVEEAQSLTEISLELLRPTIRAPGSELWFSWNPKSKRDPVDKLLRGINPPPDSIVVRANYDTNPFFPAELSEERVYDEKTKPDRYGHIWLGDYEPAAIGAYYASEMALAERELRIASVPYNPSLPVETWWDLGASKMGRTMAVGFVQRVGHELHAIDYLSDEGPDKGLPHFAKVLQAKSYVYSDHVWPHDGGHMQKATGKTLAETWKELTGCEPVVLGLGDVGAGIAAVRNMLRSMWFDAVKCEGWVEGLKNYRSEYDDEKLTFKPIPVHDWASHPADMTRTGATYTPTPKTWAPIDYSKYDKGQYV